MLNLATSSLRVSVVRSEKENAGFAKYQTDIGVKGNTGNEPEAKSNDYRQLGAAAATDNCDETVKRHWEGQECRFFERSQKAIKFRQKHR